MRGPILFISGYWKTSDYNKHLSCSAVLDRWQVTSVSHLLLSTFCPSLPHCSSLLNDACVPLHPSCFWVYGQNASLVWFHKNRMLLVLFIYLLFFFSVNVGPEMYLHCGRDCRVGKGLGAWVRIRAVFSHQIQTLILQSRKGTPTDTPQQPLSCRNLHEVILPSNRVCCSVAKFPIPSSGMLQTNSNYFLLRAIVKHYKLADSKIINTGVVTLHYNQNFNLNFHL